MGVGRLGAEEGEFERVAPEAHGLGLPGEQISCRTIGVEHDRSEFRQAPQVVAQVSGIQKIGREAEPVAESVLGPSPPAGEDTAQTGSVRGSIPPEHRGPVEDVRPPRGL